VSDDPILVAAKISGEGEGNFASALKILRGDVSHVQF